MRPAEEDGFLAVDAVLEEAPTDPGDVGGELPESLRGLHREDRERSAAEFFAALDERPDAKVDPRRTTAGDFLRAFTDEG